MLFAFWIQSKGNLQSLTTHTLSCVFISSHSRLEGQDTQDLEDYNDLFSYYLSIVFKAVLHALDVHIM